MSGCPHFPTITKQGLDPDPLLDELRRTEPIARVQLPFGDPCWVLTRYEDVRAMLADPRFESRRDHRHGCRPHVGVLPHRGLDPGYGRSRAHADPPPGERDLHRATHAGPARSRAGDRRRVARRHGGDAPAGRLRAGRRAAVADHDDLRAPRRAVRGPRPIPRMGERLHDLDRVRGRGAPGSTRAAHGVPRRSHRQPARAHRPTTSWARSSPRATTTTRSSPRAS